MSIAPSGQEVVGSYPKGDKPHGKGDKEKEKCDGERNHTPKHIIENSMPLTLDENCTAFGTRLGVNANLVPTVAACSQLTIWSGRCHRLGRRKRNIKLGLLAAMRTRDKTARRVSLKLNLSTAMTTGTNPKV